MRKVIKTTDGRFAIVERSQVTRTIAIWSPIDARRWDEAEQAERALAMGGMEPPEVKEKPKVVVDRSHLPYRSDLRITKLQKGVFIIEQKRFGKWEELKTCKTQTKAEEWCAINSRRN